MINYPNQKSLKNPKKSLYSPLNEKKVVDPRLHLSSANRGMSLEGDINLSNEYYIEQNLCVVTKRPTPINVVKVDYTHGPKIVDAYFEKQSTTDYNGVYKGKYIDFEAKQTKSKTSFPLANISAHQITHLKRVLQHGGICFFIIEFTTIETKTYLLDAKYVIEFYEKSTRKSIPFTEIEKVGYLIKRGYLPRLDYLKIVDEVYFA